MSYHNTRTWRADRQNGPAVGSRTLVKKTRADLQSRVDDAFCSISFKLKAPFDDTSCKVVVSKHTFWKFRDRGCSNDPRIAAGFVKDLLRIEGVSKQVLKMRDCDQIVIYDKELDTVYPLYLLVEESTNTLVFLVATYFCMGFNKHHVFYVEDADAVCIKVENRLGSVKGMERNTLTVGIENIPELQLNKTYKENVAP